MTHLKQPLVGIKQVQYDRNREKTSRMLSNMKVKIVFIHVITILSGLRPFSE
jgi:hypothetical protein